MTQNRSRLTLVCGLMALSLFAGCDRRTPQTDTTGTGATSGGAATGDTTTAPGSMGSGSTGSSSTMPPATSTTPTPPEIPASSASQ